MLKDADYYKQRIKDLPSDLLKEIRELYREAESHRFICMSLKELCDKIALEYSEETFDAKRQKHYMDINSYLEVLGLKLVPCSIPVDLSFYDKIYITTKPNLNNDEDCAYVSELVKSGRTPTKKDMGHISRMNTKLSNYNVMLRVFEGLFVVSSSKLDPHQRLTMNSIISELALPREGIAYLRVCYTYASEFRNRHCDYKNQQFCFKHLSPELQQRVSQYLALVAVSSNFREPFNQEYPFLEDLEKEYTKLNLLNKSRTIKDLRNDAEGYSEENTPGETNFLERRFFGLRITALNYINSLKIENSNADLTGILAKGSPILKNPLITQLYKVLGSYALKGIEKLIPKESEISLKSFDNIENHRDASCLYMTDNKTLSLLYPCICYQSSEMDQNTGSFEEFKAYLQNETVLTDKEGSPKTVTSDKTNSYILFMTFFLRLIIKNAFIEYNEKDNKKALEDLSEEFLKTSKTELLFIQSLFYALFTLPSVLSGAKSSIGLSEETVRSLLIYPQLNHLFLYTLFTNKNSSSVQELYSLLPECFEILIYNAIKANKDLKIRGVKDLKFTNSILGTFLLEKIRYAIAANGGISDFIEIKCGDRAVESLESLPQRNLSTSILIDNSIRQLGGVLYRDLAPVITHPVFANLLSPVLCYDALKIITSSEVSAKSSSLQIVSDALAPNENIIKYLGTISGSTVPMIAKLVTGRINRLDEQLIRRNLKDFTFTKYAQLCYLFKSEYSYLAVESIEQSLPKLGLMIVPIDQSLPKEARNRLNYHKVIPTGLERNALDEEFIKKLCAAQMAYIIFSFIVPVSAADVRLARYMDLSPELNVFTLKFLQTLSTLIRGIAPFDKAFYQKLQAEQKTNENFKLCKKYLKQLAVDEVSQSPLKNYLENKFNEIFALLGIRDHSLVKSENQSTNSSAEKDRKAEESAAVWTSGTNRIRTSEHSFFKAVSFDSKKLDSSLIASKLNESAQIQDVITKIRIDEGTLSEDDSMNKSQIDSMVQEESQNENYGDSIHDTGLKLPSESSCKLVNALKAQNSDVMDLNEFSGMCLSFKFMSRDVAIEEINDWSYEHFDEPLLEAVPEENCIYITTDILEKL